MLLQRRSLSLCTKTPKDAVSGTLENVFIKRLLCVAVRGAETRLNVIGGMCACVGMCQQQQTNNWAPMSGRLNRCKNVDK